MAPGDNNDRYMHQILKLDKSKWVWRRNKLGTNAAPLQHPPNLTKIRDGSVAWFSQNYTILTFSTVTNQTGSPFATAVRFNLIKRLYIPQEPIFVTNWLFLKASWKHLENVCTVLCIYNLCGHTIYSFHLNFCI